MATPRGRYERVDPVDIEMRRRRWRRRAIGLVVVLLFAGFIYWRFLAPVPVDYTSDLEHFKYGSIGSDYDGVPRRIWQVLPEMFPEYLPDRGAGYMAVPEVQRTYLDAYAQFGILVEPNKPLPVGFSQRRVYVDRVGLNCAVCHTSTLDVAGAIDPKRVYGVEPSYILRRNESDHQHTSRSILIAGMPANTVDLEAYFVFLFRCAEDPRFNADTIMSAVKDAAERSGDWLGPIEKAILKFSIPRLRETLLERRRQLHYVALLHDPDDPDVMPRFGPGRIDTFTPYKSIQFGFPYDGTFGIADYPSIWNQRPREGLQLHWDGNNTSVFERNISAAIGAGVTPNTLDMHRMLRVADWIGSPRPPNPEYGGNPDTADALAMAEERDDPFPREGELAIPRYPFPVDTAVAEHGEKLFSQYCYECHGWTGKRLGDVVDIRDIGTDPSRLDSYTEALQANQNLLGAGKWWRFNHFRKTYGYANSPLDGVWIRAPYLHNGSVPTLLDLFAKPCDTADLESLGITAETDLTTLAENAEQVAKIIESARAAGLRPPVFYRADDQYDPQRGGFRCDRASTDDGRRLFFFKTFVVRDGKVQTLLGNGHEGHYGPQYGSNLSAEDKAALVEYQKMVGQR